MEKNSIFNIFEKEMLSDEDILSLKESSKDHYFYNSLKYSIAPGINNNIQIKEMLLLIMVNMINKDNNPKFNNGTINILIICEQEVDKFELISFMNYMVPHYNNEFNYKVNKDIFSFEYSETINDNALQELLLSDNDLVMICDTKYNNFDYSKKAYENVNVSSQIFSCFDLVFLMTYAPNELYNPELAEQILKIHQTNGVYEIPYKLLKKYLIYVNENIEPHLTDEAREILNNIDLEIKNNNSDIFGDVNITNKHFELINRLAKAKAKLKLKEYITKEDIQDAKKLTLYGIYYDCDPPGSYDSFNFENDPNSFHEMLKKLIKELELLEEEYDKNIPLNVLMSNMAEKYNIDKHTTEETLHILIKKGMISETTPSHICLN